MGSGGRQDTQFALRLVSMFEGAVFVEGCWRWWWEVVGGGGRWWEVVGGGGSGERNGDISSVSRERVAIQL